MTELRLGGNQLTGAIPPELGALRSLSRLWLAGNQLSGEIPPELGALRNLDWLELSGNRLTGPIPPELGALSHLESLDLDRNRLTGPIPPELGDLHNLRSLDLSGNRLTGPIPPELGALRRLGDLRLAGNELTGSIPPEFGLLSGLSHLDLSYNQLTGGIPPALGALVNLSALILSHNQLTGRIPPAIGSIYLWALELHDNDLIGPIPASLRLPGQPFGHSQSSLLLYGNPGLTGCLPPGWERPGQDGQTSLSECPPELPPEELCENGTAVPDPADKPGLVSDCATLLAIRDPLAGDVMLDWDADRPIATWEGITIGGDPLRVVGLALPSRDLTGHLPARLRQLVGLRELGLQDNRLSGPIPFKWGLLRALESLGLHGNRLIGPIPATLGGLPNLESLQMHDNRLSGPIPATLTYPRTLERLSLGSNAGLSGCIPPALQDVAENDLADLGLPGCTPPPPPVEVCGNGTVVAEAADNPGLVADCVALLATQRALVSNKPLNWEQGRPITEWEGVTIGGTPRRVEGLDLGARGFAGPIPPALADLSGLRTCLWEATGCSGQSRRNWGTCAPWDRCVWAATC